MNPTAHKLFSATYISLIDSVFTHDLTHFRNMYSALIALFWPISHSVLSILLLLLFNLCFLSAVSTVPLASLFSGYLLLVPSILPSLSHHRAFIYRETWQEILILLRNRSLTNTSTNQAFQHTNTDVESIHHELSKHFFSFLMGLHMEKQEIQKYQWVEP